MGSDDVCDVGGTVVNERLSRDEVCRDGIWAKVGVVNGTGACEVTEVCNVVNGVAGVVATGRGLSPTHLWHDEWFVVEIKVCPSPR